MKSMTTPYQLSDKTLVFLIDPLHRQVLLAMKKRGFGVGKWNGVGGKVEQGETIIEAAVREANEEIGVSIDPAHLSPAATLTFHWDATPDWDCVVHVFVSDRWEGVPSESEEMRPQWFSYGELPLDSMWEDDRYWLPKVLRGETVQATFWFGPDGALRTHESDIALGV